MAQTIVQNFGYVTDRAREVLNDNPSDAKRRRWSEAMLLRWAHEGIEELGKVRPASKYYGLMLVRRELVSIPDNTATTEEEQQAYDELISGLRAQPLLLDERWHNAIVDYICYRAFVADEGGEISSARAQTHRKAFEAGAMM